MSILRISSLKASTLSSSSSQMADLLESQGTVQPGPASPVMVRYRPDCNANICMNFRFQPYNQPTANLETRVKGAVLPAPGHVGVSAGPGVREQFYYLQKFIIFFTALKL